MMTSCNSSSRESSCPLVTVVTATYNLLKGNRADEIRQCMQSVHGQTYSNIEHIVIDGASTDGTLELLSEYEQKWGVKVYSEPDEGIYDAFNKGISKARGKYIAFLNSDDLWHDSHGVEESVKALEKKGADFSYAPCIMEGGEPPVQDFNISFFVFRTPFNHQTMFTRTDCLRRLGGFDKQYKVYADCDVIVRLLMGGARAVRVPLCFTTFRAGGFWQSCDPEVLRIEREQMFRNNFSLFLSEPEFEWLWKFRISPHFRKILRRMVHPSIYRNVRINFCWNQEDQTWDYLWVLPARRSRWCRFVDKVIYLIDRLVPWRPIWRAMFLPARRT